MKKTASSRDEMDGNTAEALVGRKLRQLRNRQNLSLRELAERSGLNINTLSMIETGKSSPSVSTLQQLALALNEPLIGFFESEPVEKTIVFTPRNDRPRVDFGGTCMENLGKELAGNRIQPFIVTLDPGRGSGDRMIVHTGNEFVYCLSGSVHYRIEGQDYFLKSGDSLVFESHLPHCWENDGAETAQIMLVIVPSDEKEEPGGRHFSLAYMKKELSMKIAVITDDGKTISKHFGRAQYYAVVTFEEGKITHREIRNKLGHNAFHATGHEEDHHGPEHGMDAASHNKHVGMAEAIADCQALICGGMGMGAYESMRRLNIRPIVTDIEDIDAAALAFIEGRLIDHTEFLH